MFKSGETSKVEHNQFQHAACTVQTVFPIGNTEVLWRTSTRCMRASVTTFLTLKSYLLNEMKENAVSMMKRHTVLLLVWPDIQYRQTKSFTSYYCIVLSVYMSCCTMCVQISYAYNTATDALCLPNNNILHFFSVKLTDFSKASGSGWFNFGSHFEKHLTCENELLLDWK